MYWKLRDERDDAWRQVSKGYLDGAAAGRTRRRIVLGMFAAFAVLRPLTRSGRARLPTSDGNDGRADGDRDTPDGWNCRPRRKAGQSLNTLFIWNRLWNEPTKEIRAAFPKRGEA